MNIEDLRVTCNTVIDGLCNEIVADSMSIESLGPLRALDTEIKVFAGNSRVGTQWLVPFQNEGMRHFLHLSESVVAQKGTCLRAFVACCRVTDTDLPAARRWMLANAANIRGYLTYSQLHDGTTGVSFRLSHIETLPHETLATQVQEVVREARSLGKVLKTQKFALTPVDLFNLPEHGTSYEIAEKVKPYVRTK